MVLLGQLSAGIAHEINNPITYINLNMETLKDYAEKLLNLFNASRDLAVTDSVQPVDLAHKWEEIRRWHELNDKRTRVLIEDLGRLAQETLDGGLRVAEIT